MRFLTVEELVARRDCETWSAEWIQRASVAEQSVSTNNDIEGFSILYNEGTLLLYRMGFLELTRRACRQGLRSRSSPHEQGLATFAIQQWINLSRLDIAAGLPKHCERRLQHLEVSLERLTESLSPDDLRKTMIVCLVERVALLLSQGDLRAICSLKRAVPASLKPEVEVFMIESVARCLVKIGRFREALNLVSRGLIAFDDRRSLAPLMVLLATLRPLTVDEADLLLRMMTNRIAERPVHNVQVCEFLLRNCLPENRTHFMGLIESLWTSSMQVGDVVTLRFLTEIWDDAPHHQPAGAFLSAFSNSSSTLPHASSVIAKQLDRLLQRVCPSERLHV